MSIIDGSIEYEVRTMPSTNDLNISDFAHTFLDDTSASEVRNTLDLASKNELGFRKPNTAYTIGQIAYHSALPMGCYLECTTAGTTNNSDIIPTSTIGNTISDGTVIWTIMKNLSMNGGKVPNGFVITNKSNTGVEIHSGSVYYNGAHLALYGKDGYIYDDIGKFKLCAANGDDFYTKRLIGSTDGSLIWNFNDLAGAAIQVKSLGTNSYIKYASGLIVQWGANTLAETNATITFPISFTNDVSISVMPEYGHTLNEYTLRITMRSTSAFSVQKYGGDNGSGLTYIAIGY